MTNERIVELLMQIRESSARMEQKLDDHVEDCAQRDATVRALEKDMIKAKASVKTLRWIAGLIFVTLPASVYAVMRISGK